MLVIDNLETATAYSAPLTLESVFGGRLVYIVANESAIARFRPLLDRESSLKAEYGPEVLLTPQSATIDRISGVQFRSAIAGSPARIIAQLSDPGDILPAAGTPFTGTLAGSGSVTEPGAGVTVLGYSEFTAPVAATGTEAAPTTVVQLPALTLDGATPITIVFFAPAIMAPLAASPSFGVSLWAMGVADLGRLFYNTADAFTRVQAGNAGASRRLTPTAGTWTYGARAWREVGGTATVQAGPGGAGQFLPGYILCTTP